MNWPAEARHHSLYQRRVAIVSLTVRRAWANTWGIDRGGVLAPRTPNTGHLLTGQRRSHAHMSSSYLPHRGGNVISIDMNT